MWSLVAFSIPEDNRAARDALRKQLRWRGFAPLYDGLWVSPRDHAAEVIGYLKDLDIATGTAFRATSVTADGEIPAQAWDLDGLRRRYESFIGFAGQLRDAAAAGRVPPTDALIARTRVMDEWRAFPGLDPDLPAELLPAGGLGRPLASCSSGATTCSARWPPCGSARSSPGTARNWPTAPPITVRS